MEKYSTQDLNLSNAAYRGIFEPFIAYLLAWAFSVPNRFKPGSKWNAKLEDDKKAQSRRAQGRHME